MINNMVTKVGAPRASTESLRSQRKKKPHTRIYFAPGWLLSLSRRQCARGLFFLSNLHQQVQHDPNIGKRDLFAAQTRTQKIKQPVSEFGKTVAFAVPLNAANDDESLKNFPKGSRILT